MDMRHRYLMWIDILMFFVGFGLVFAAAYAFAESGGAGTDQVEPPGVTWEDRLQRSEPDVRDRSLTAAVGTALKLEPELAGFPLEVSTQNAVVILMGTVATETQKKQAGRAAMRTEGVGGVENRIKVNPAAKPQPLQLGGEQRAERTE